MIINWRFNIAKNKLDIKRLTLNNIKFDDFRFMAEINDDRIYRVYILFKRRCYNKKFK